MQTLQSLFTKHWIFIVSVYFPFALRYTFPFLVYLFVGIYGIYLKFDLGPLALISILFINIAIVI